MIANKSTSGIHLLRKDPARTSGIVDSFSKEVSKIFRSLKESIYKVFKNNPTFNSLSTSTSRLKRFRAWLRKEMNSTLIGDDVVAEYISRAYKQGAERGYSETTKERHHDYSDVSQLHQQGKDTQWLSTFLQKASIVDKVNLLASRCYGELQGITPRMGIKLSRVLIDGLITGKSNSDIAKLLSDEIDIEEKRALVIVNTEISSANAEGTLDALETQGVKGVNLEVEWITTDKPCPKCSAMGNKIYPIEEARGLIPLHPSCRCKWLPILDPNNILSFRKLTRNMGHGKGSGIPGPLSEHGLDHITSLPKGGRKWEKSLSENERFAVEDWIEDQSEIRDHFSKGELNDRDKDFISAIHKAPIVKGQVYRGMNIDRSQIRQFLETMKEGYAWTDKTPHSMSRSINESMKFTQSIMGQKVGVILVIHSKTGRSIEGVFEDQKEVIGLPGTSYKIKKVDYNGYSGIKFPVIHVDEVEHTQVTNMGHGIGSGIPGPIAGETHRSEAKIGTVKQDKKTIDAITKGIFGDKHKEIMKNLHELCGSIGNGTAKVRILTEPVMYGGRVHHVPVVGINIETDDYKMDRKFYVVEGKKICSNESFEVNEDKKGKGLGLKVFQRQVAALVVHGFDEIHTFAAGDAKDPEYIGYKVWPKFGYDGPLEGSHRTSLEDGTGHKLFSSCNTIHQLFSLNGGIEAWDKYGSDIDLVFDLKHRSPSRTILAAYVAKKASQAKKTTERELQHHRSKGSHMNDMVMNKESKQVEEPAKPRNVETPDVTDDDMEAIDSVWADIIKAGGVDNLKDKVKDKDK